MRLGLVGVLLLVGFPVMTVAVPVVATLLNARLKVRRAALVAVFEICMALLRSGQKSKDQQALFIP